MVQDDGAGGTGAGAEVPTFAVVVDGPAPADAVVTGTDAADVTSLELVGSDASPGSGTEHAAPRSPRPAERTRTSTGKLRCTPPTSDVRPGPLQPQRGEVTIRVCSCTTFSSSATASRRADGSDHRIRSTLDRAVNVDRTSSLAAGRA